MKRILLSLLTAGAVGALAFGASQAFFSDTETSTGNTFTAGELDLKVDNECHYWTWEGEHDPQDPSRPLFVDRGCDPDGAGPIVTDWTLSDLVSGVHKFFYFNDVKPGDYGEDTVSLHVYDNDAWGRLIIDKLADLENSCEEPEEDEEGPDCNAPDGELRESLRFWVWLDQGMTPGFQGRENAGEGDNIYDPVHELELISPGEIDEPGETWYLADGLSATYRFYGCGIGETPLVCPGLEPDGHMVGSITYYFGIGWDLPSEVGNEVQSDSFSGDMTIEVEQYRNNPTPWD